jgi:phage baseplate assembly protein W
MNDLSTLRSKTSLGFPFGTTSRGHVQAQGGDDAIRARILQVLFTAPGERVHKPDFGCGLFNQVFAPNDAVRAAATEFTVGQALARWLGDDIIVDAVSVEPDGEVMRVQVVYTRRHDERRQAVQIQFS